MGVSIERVSTSFFSCGPRKAMRFLLHLTVTTLLLVPAAKAQEILILGLNGDLHSVSPQTGASSFVGLTGHHTYFWSAMTQDSQGRLYATTGNDWVGYSVYEIDPNTGLGSFVTQTNLFGIGCMAFGPGDILYVGNDPTFPLSGGTYDLHTLDLNTGLATFIGNTGAVLMHGMDYSDGSLWGYAETQGLFQIDAATGITTDVNSNYWGPWGATTSLCFNDDGTLFYLDEALWMMDKETGVASAVDWLRPFGYWAEAVFVEGPAPSFSLWFSGTSNGQMGVKLSGATPGGQVGFAWAKGGGGPTPIPPGLPCAGVMMNLNSTMSLLGVATADGNGKAVLGPQFVPSSAVGTIRVQAIDLSTCAVSNKVILAY